MKARVLLIPRPEIPDPRSESLAKTLEEGGFDAVVSVRQGRFFEIDVSTTDPAVAKAQITEMANQHLVDLEIEDIEVLVPGAGPEAFGVVAVYDRRQGERRSGERRSGDDRRSGRDRRLDGPEASEVDKNRRSGSERRECSGRRSGGDRRDERDRRTGMDRRDGAERRSGDDEEDFSGPERRGWTRRRGEE